MRNACFVFCIVCSLFIENWTADIVEFIFHNQELCGNPFSDAQWLPVLDTCEIECDVTEKLCVEDDMMTQRCNKLPSECVAAFKKQEAKRAAIRQMPTMTTLSSIVRPYAGNQPLKPLSERNSLNKFQSARFQR